MTSPSPPVALVTGANRSIGLQIARELAGLGYSVFLGARDLAAGKAAAHLLAGEGLTVHPVHIDLNDPGTHSSAATTIAAQKGRLDVLVNNAAVVDDRDGPASTAAADALRRMFETNVIGTLAVTQAMLPLLRKSSAGRVVNLSSALGSIAEAADDTSEFAAVRLAGYAISKAALNMLTVQLAVELKDAGIRVNSVDPGFTATDMNGHQGYQSLQEGAAEAVRVATLSHGPTSGFSATGRTLPW